MEENELMMKNFEYYKGLFKTQIEELENQLVLEKLTLATEAEEIDVSFENKHIFLQEKGIVFEIIIV